MSSPFGQASLGATIAYLRFPLRAEHRGGLRDGSRCPHCQGSRIQKWGRFAGRQRFRCRDCRRTFSTFTATPLRYLKCPERWRAFLWCMEGRLTVRRSGAVVGIDKNTALRWRHRVLDHWRLEPHRLLRGCVEVGQLGLLRNEKGSRCLGRPARRHGHAAGRRGEPAESIDLFALLETDGDGTRDHWIGRVDGVVSRPADYARVLGPRLGQVRELVGGRGSFCALGRYATSVGIAHSEEGRGRGASVTRLRVELIRWLRPFRGVATHRLGNYLEWFRRMPSGQLPRRRASRTPTIPADSTRAKREGGPAPAAEIVPGPGTDPAA